MCLILLAHKVHPKYKLIIAANRDEFYGRPTKQANFWNEEEDILAGKDLEAGGTWLGMSKSGKISMLTNYRDLRNIKQNAPSRGHLVLDYLKSASQPKHYLTGVSENGGVYNGFNIICGDINELHYYGNYQQGVHKMDKGIHGLSNALLDSPWPKVVKGKEKLLQIISQNNIDIDILFDSLYDDLSAQDNLLPDTGVGYEKEKMLSPMFIKSENYGSRCSTVILVDNDDNVEFAERTYDPKGYNFDVVKYSFQVDNL